MGRVIKTMEIQMARTRSLRRLARFLKIRNASELRRFELLNAVAAVVLDRGPKR